MGSSELLLPKALLHLVVIVRHLRRLNGLISWAFDALGLRDILNSDDDACPELTSNTSAEEQEQQYLHHPKFQSVSAILIQEFLPSVPHEDVAAAECDACTVCLSEFGVAEEVRRLRNCRHVFHRCCLDGWIEHDQTTCPLCRASLFSDVMAAHGGDYYERVLEAAGVPDSYYADVGDYLATSISISPP